MTTATGPVHVIACGALARELLALAGNGDEPRLTVTCLPAVLHNTPERIPELVRAAIHDARRRGHGRILVGYADCGTGGLLDRVCAEEGVERLPGAHCYELFAGRDAFAALHEREPGTFYLTDYLARYFDEVVVRGLGLDRHPELEPVYFGNYRRLVYLAQTDDPDLVARARRAADRLGLAFEVRRTGLDRLASALAGAAAGCTFFAAGAA